MLMLFFVQFSNSCDTVASLMKIPQYFLIESPEAENTQVCIQAFQQHNITKSFMKTLIF